MKWRFKEFAVGDNDSMSIAPQPRANESRASQPPGKQSPAEELQAELSEPDSVATCAVCGASVEGGSIEDSSGWRWFSDGRGGLLSLCASCPVPDGITEPV